MHARHIRQLASLAALVGLTLAATTAEEEGHFEGMLLLKRYGAHIRTPIVHDLTQGSCSEAGKLRAPSC